MQFFPVRNLAFIQKQTTLLSVKTFCWRFSHVQRKYGSKYLVNFKLYVPFNSVLEKK